MSITSSTSNRNSTKLRVVFLGDQGVGKSSIIDRYTTSRFNDNYNATVGIDFNVKDLNRYGQVFRLQMWDTAGQERYRSLIPTYLKNAHCVIFVFDVTNPNTLQGVRGWQRLFVQHQQAPGILVGNKIDMTSARKVSREEGEQLAKQLRLNYCEVSAKTGKRVNQLFEELIDLILEMRRKEEDLVQTSRSKMKQMNTIAESVLEAKQQSKQGKKMSLKAGSGWSRKLNCCSQ